MTILNPLCVLFLVRCDNFDLDDFGMTRLFVKQFSGYFFSKTGDPIIYVLFIFINKTFLDYKLFISSDIYNA